MESPFAFVKVDDRPDEWVSMIKELWRSLAGEVFVQYESALRNGNTNSVSNFTKGDETYRGQILNELLKMTYVLRCHHRRREDACGGHRLVVQRGCQ